MASDINKLPPHLLYRPVSVPAYQRFQMCPKKKPQEKDQQNSPVIAPSRRENIDSSKLNPTGFSKGHLFSSRGLEVEASRELLQERFRAGTISLAEFKRALRAEKSSPPFPSNKRATPNKRDTALSAKSPEADDGSTTTSPHFLRQIMRYRVEVQLEKARVARGKEKPAAFPVDFYETFSNTVTSPYPHIKCSVLRPKTKLQRWLELSQFDTKHGLRDGYDDGILFIPGSRRS
ncbi:hypothetical protein V5O48_014769 [Marasmius crinis-equi]|uniref:SHOCT domain-containing protein n=1 Tax=Marasmius crinis-equi TaxID=585013 RepID=A0ABR3EWD1_9AGAR